MRFKQSFPLGDTDPPDKDRHINSQNNQENPADLSMLVVDRSNSQEADYGVDDSFADAEDDDSMTEKETGSNGTSGTNGTNRNQGRKDQINPSNKKCELNKQLELQMTPWHHY